MADLGQIRHRCKPGEHQRLICKIVDNKLEFVCDGCKAKFYWNTDFLEALIDLCKTGGEGFYMVFD